MLYRCQNAKCSEDPHGRLIFDFEGTEPVCPKCGTDGRKRPQVVIKREVVHYEAPGPVEGYGVGHPACAPGKRALRRSGAPQAVTCAACKGTEAFRQALAALDGPEDGLVDVPADQRDFPVEIDLARGVIKKKG